ncbi:HNH endonuclease [Herbidospora solisilvae]|uniref:HNH endonuclease n=1 Tax=Herbidospora solisilvae TaxID=2696284 RepID=UPI001929861C|nr:HNH endonuclease [Herbidospora solisilvae]
MLKRTAELVADNVDSGKARKAWEGATSIKRGIRWHLEIMAAGIERCMYCGDSLGTDIDHFEPIAHAPARVFDWLNHLLACSSCNSNAKREKFPCDENGNCLLVNPTTEDPYDHMRLTLSSGSYYALSDKGRETINALDLNRRSLTRGRERALPRCRAMIIAYDLSMQDGRVDQAREFLVSLCEQPFADVLYAMLKVAADPGAADVIGGSHIVRIILGEDFQREILLLVGRQMPSF